MIFQKNTVKKLLAKLIAQNTVNPPGNEYKAVKEIIPFLKQNRIRFKKFEKEKNRSNLIASIGKGRPKLMIVTHLDTVPEGSGWKTNPFKAIEKKGNVFGRGAEDNKGPTVAALLAIKKLKKKEKNLQGKFSVAMLADEERSSKNGMHYLLEKKLIKPDYAIVVDNGKGMKEINVGEKGALRVKVTAYGKQAHGSLPEKGINAIQPIAEFITELKKMKMKYKKIKLFTKPTINVGTISGGEAVNMVPAKCETELDIRYLPGQKVSEMVKEIKKLTKRVKTKAGIKVEVIAKDPPWLLEKETVLAKKLKEKTKQVTGKEPKITGLSGATDARKLIRKKCIAIGFGIGNDQAHKANEYIELKQVNQLAEIIELVAIELLRK